ncbi:hypothetical protein GJ744_005491 [Endocarpon pusillum]|uniref:Nucleoside phosphorylase domain-containing protein n=1 Tax=Endocarpon pusillum TaxID=364733 RepID=A0A8H7A8F1_9EURO|nr:hypothetical protein GJ744_005491 [Endocarpon pusillum]
MEHGDYTVGWICALPTELAAAVAMLDERHNHLPQDSHDHNNYTLGRIGVHNVAIACLPSGVTGITSAAIVASHIRSTFPSIRFGLMVGVGGGAPSVENDIRLGDVVISKPDGASGGVIQYDFGKTVQEGRFVQTGSLNRPPSVLLSAVNTLQANHLLKDPELTRHLSEMSKKFPRMQAAGAYPGVQHDQLFKAEYSHPPGNDTCTKCDPLQAVCRSIRSDSVPGAYYGLIASANQVMRDGMTRERLQQELDVLCFEMEAAGLMDDFPCLVIRGICDYADAHKNKRWQPYAAAVAAAYAKELLCVIPADQLVCTRPIGEASAQGAQHPPIKPVFTVPFRKDNKFVDRKLIFSQVEEHLRLHHCASLSGMGGVGKSQIAIEYAYRFQQSHPQSHVFWIFAANSTQFVQAYQDIARKLRLPGCEDSDVNQCELVSKWLDEDNSSGWLMILDNVDNADLFLHSTDLNPSSAGTDRMQRLLIDYVPRRLDSKRLLINTTRSRHVGENLIDGESCIEVPPFSIQEAESLLRLNAEDAVDRCKPAVIKRLLDILGYVPLAITQAAAFIKRNRMSVQGYLAALEKDKQNLMDHLSQELQDPRRPRGFPNSVFQTWKLSFDQILTQEPQTAKLLSLIAMLDPQRIPERLLRPLAERDVDFRMALGTLDGFALITQEIGGETYAIHPLVQASVHYWLKQRNEKAYYASQALQLLAEKFPSGKHDHRERCESMLAHAQAVLCYDCVSENDLRHRAALLYRVGWFNLQQGRYISAYQEASESYKINRERLGEDATTTLDSLSLLALVLEHQGRYEAAEEMNRRALEGKEKVLGVEHPNTLASVDNLASVLRYQGKYKTAEEMYRRALEGFEKMLGVEHPDTLTSINNLALVLEHQGKYKTAEEMYQRVLEGSEKVLGVEHPDTLTSVNNLALVLRYQGRYEAAEKMNQRALEGSEKVLGVEHPSTLTSVNSLARVLREQGKYKAAKKMHQRALEGKEKVLGVEHPDTLTSVNDLALVLHNQGKYKAAEEMHQRALEGFEKVLGVGHPSTLTSVNNLALALQKQEKYKAANEMHQRALEGKEKMLGVEHPSTLTSVNNLALVLYNQGKYKAAEEMYQRALEGKEKVLGVEHPSTLTSIDNLVLVLRKQGKYKAAEEIELKSTRRKREGAESGPASVI